MRSFWEWYFKLQCFNLVLLPEPSPRLLTGGAYAKNLPPAGFLNAAGFPLFSVTLKIHPFLRYFAHGEFRRLRTATKGFALGTHFLFFREAKGSEKKLRRAARLELR